MTASGHGGSFGLRAGDVGRLLLTWVFSAIALALAGLLLSDLSASSPWDWFAASAIAGIVGLFVRPVIVLLTAWVGWIAVLLGGLLGQALVIYLSLRLVPGITETVSSAFWASWIAAAVGTAISWVGTSGTDEAFFSSLMRHRGRVAEVDDPEVDGVVFVQLDGVAFPVLRWAVQAGAVPTIRRWITSGDHVLREWTPQLPCTTPASQLGLLHGTVAGVPAFRWWDRELGRVLIANRPADAAVIEARATTGRGLLADGGLSLSNLFTGDAPRSMLTMSRTTVSRGSVETRRTLAGFLNDPRGFMRGLVRAIGEIIKERWQAKRQERRDLVPRVHRGWTFAGLRAATNVIQRDLNTAIIAEEMRKGTRSIYVNYVDYDEIAHHAGMFRPESLAALDGVDHVLGTLERLAAGAARRYHLVVVSDHGQSQGQPFADRYGTDLGSLCSRLMETQVESIEQSVEGEGRAAAVAEDVGGVAAMVAGHAAETSRRAAESAGSGADISVLGSGNLGLLYVHSPTRLSIEELEDRWPGLLPGLRAHDGIGFVAGVDRQGLPWAYGAHGRVRLDTGEVEGEDPMAPFGERATSLLCRAVLMPESPDLYLNSRVDEVTLDVAAFEPLVGAHGGLGGWQDRAMLLVPRELADSLPAERIEGADHLHLILVAMLESLGHRRQLADHAPAAD